MAQQPHSRKRSRQAPHPAALPAEAVIDLTGDDTPPAPALAPAPALDGAVLRSDSEDERTLPQRRRRRPSAAEDVILQAHARQQALELEVSALQRELQVRAPACMAASYAQWQRLCGSIGLIQLLGHCRRTGRGCNLSRGCAARNEVRWPAEVLQRFRPHTCWLGPGSTRQHACLTRYATVHMPQNMRH